MSNNANKACHLSTKDGHFRVFLHEIWVTPEKLPQKISQRITD